MWLLQPAKGRTAIRNVWRDLLRSIPDYKIDILHIATEPASNDAFVMWRASGTARLSLIPQRPTTNKPFEHCGVTRWGCRSCTVAALRSAVTPGVLGRDMLGKRPAVCQVVHASRCTAIMQACRVTGMQHHHQVSLLPSVPAPPFCTCLTLLPVLLLAGPAAAQASL
jgi:hypothetical protein